MKRLSIKALVSIGVLSSIAFILMLLDFPIPPFPQFLKIDFSDIPALVAALIYGPVAGILVAFLKNMLHFFMTGSETGVPVGNIANFMASILFVLPTYFVYQKLKSKRGMTLGLILGSCVMAISLSVLNYYVFLPAYSFFLNWPAMSTPEMRILIVTGILPFNFIKGVIVMIVFLLLFKRINPLLVKQGLNNRTA